MKLECFRQISEKCSNIKLHENMSSGSRNVPCRRTDGQTDRHDEANSGLPQFYERPQKNAEHGDQSANVSPLAFSRHALPIQGRTPIILSDVVHDFPQTPYSTFKYLITVSFLVLSSLPNPIIPRIIQNTITAAAVSH